MTPPPRTGPDTAVTDLPDPPLESSDATVAAEAGQLRIALLSDAIPGRNGVGTYYDDLLAHLGDRVAEIRVFAPPRSRDDPYDGLRLPMPGDPTQGLFIPHVTRVWREVRDFSPHVIVAPTPGLYGVLSLFMARRFDVPLCVGYHTQFSKLMEMYWEDTLGWLWDRLARWWDSLFFRAAASVLVHSEGLEEAVRQGGGEVRLVGTPAPHRFIAEPVAPLPDEPRRITFLGRLAPEKRLEQVEEAARRHPGLDFHIVGDGPLRPDVEGWAREHANIEFTPWVARDRVMELLDRTDILVLPSRFETFGTAAFEAMARGRIAVVSANCGIAQWPALAAGLFQMEAGEPLADALDRVLALDPSSRLEVAERGRLATVQLNGRTVEHWIEVLLEAAEVRTA